MLRDVVWAFGGVLIGSILGKILVRGRGERWRNSIRGLIFATTLIAIATYFVVSRWPK